MRGTLGLLVLASSLLAPSGFAQSVATTTTAAVVATSSTSTVVASPVVASPVVASPVAEPAPEASAAPSGVRPGDARGLVDHSRFEPEDAVLFLPRLLLLAPRWALSLVYWPLSHGLRLIEKYYVVEHIEDLIYNDARTAGFLPFITGFPGAGLSGGGRLFHNDLFGHGESLAVSAAFGGLYSQSYGVSFSADHVGGSRLWFDGEVAYAAKPSLYFVGIGDPTSVAAGMDLNPNLAAIETRFAEQRFLGRFLLGTMHGRPGSLIRTGVSLIYNHRRFEGARRLRTNELSTDLVYDTALIPGFDDGADTVEITADLILDYRNHPARPTDGFLLELFAGGVPKQGNWQYFHWGVEASAYLELFAKDRVLVLRGVLEGVEGDTDRIPFTELPRLGGPRRLRGYRLNTFRDEKAILGTVEYRWHVHQFVTASLFVDVGQVNDNYVDLVLTGDDSNWKAGFGGGLRIGSAETTLVNIDISYGDRIQVLVSTEPLKAFADRTSKL